MGADATDEPPRRRYRLLIDVSADDPGSLRQALADISFWAYEKGDKIAQTGDCITGGVSCGWSVVGEYRPEVTHESYFAAIETRKGKLNG